MKSLLLLIAGVLALLSADPESPVLVQPLRLDNFSTDQILSVMRAAPLPPPHQRGDAMFQITMGSAAMIATNCGVAPGENVMLVACVYDQRRQMFVPNPCPFADKEAYARTLCHELGHVNGWKHSWP